MSCKLLPPPTTTALTFLHCLPSSQWSDAECRIQVPKSHFALTFTLDLMNIFLLNTEGQAEVDDFKDAVLTGPEDVAGLQVSVHDASSVEGKERDQNILGKLETRPRRQPASIIFVNNLKRISR